MVTRLYRARARHAACHAVRPNVRAAMVVVERVAEPAQLRQRTLELRVDVLEARVPLRCWLALGLWRGVRRHGRRLLRLLLRVVGVLLGVRRVRVVVVRVMTVPRRRVISRPAVLLLSTWARPAPTTPTTWWTA